MISFVKFCVFCAAVLGVFGQNDDFTVSSGSEDYIKAVQNELFHQIELLRKDADTLDARYADRLAVIELHQQRVINETQQVNQTFIPLQALSFSRKFCIQAYDSQWKSVAMVQDQFKGCIDRVRSSLTYYVKNYLSNAYAYALNQLPQSAYSCKSYAKNQTKFEDCCIETVRIGTQSVKTQIENAQRDLKSRLNQMEDNTLTAVKCSFEIQKSVMAQMNTYTKQVSDCFDQMSNKDVSTNTGRKSVG